MDTRKTFVLKHLEHVMLQSLIEYFYAAQITQIAALHKDNPVEYKGFEGIYACYIQDLIAFLGLKTF